MSEAVNNRMVVRDVPGGPTRTKTTAEIVRENEQLAQRFAAARQHEALKQAIRQGNLKGLAEQAAAPPPETEVIKEPEPIQEVQAAPEQKVEEVKMTVATGKKVVSLKFGVVGSGQAGGRLAEVCWKYGYDACAINTAHQDLELLDIDADRKYLIDNKEHGGSGKDLDISAQCYEERETEIREFIDAKVGECDAFILALSGAGGSGSGSAELLATWLGETGKPLVVIYVLPGAYDDSQGKYNAITTLDRLADLTSRDVINSLILVDNANIELAYPNLSQAAFFKTANRAVIEPLHLFNCLSVMPTSYESLDSMDFAKSLLESTGCAVFGSSVVSKETYEDDEMALVSSIITGLDRGLLASGFDLKEAQTVSILVTAKESVLESIPYNNIAYIFKYIGDEFASAKSFKGVYAVPSDNDDITVRFIFSGMGLPASRVNNLKEEVKKHIGILETKKKATNLSVGLNKDRAGSEIDRNIAKLKKKKSGIGKLLGSSAAKKPAERTR